MVSKKRPGSKGQLRAWRKMFLKCDYCRRDKRRKRMKPYGLEGGKFWCMGCDANLVSTFTKSIKKRARQIAKKVIRFGDGD